VRHSLRAPRLGDHLEGGQAGGYAGLVVHVPPLDVPAAVYSRISVQGEEVPDLDAQGYHVGCRATGSSMRTSS
jgi:hypothetical protein